MPRPISDPAVPEWVHVAIATWARSERRILDGGYPWRDKGGLGETEACGFHWDGYSTRNVLAKIHEMHDGAGAGTAAGQHYAEALVGQALQVRRAMQGMPEMPYLALYLVHVFDQREPARRIAAKVKAEWLGCTVPQLFAAASRARVWIHARLEAMESGETKSFEGIRDFIALEITKEMRKDLQDETAQCTNSRKVPEPPQSDTDFSPLRRPTLTLKRA